MSSSSTSIHVTALDGLVNVNSLFMLGVFLVSPLIPVIPLPTSPATAPLATASPATSSNHRSRNLQTVIKGHLHVKVFPCVHKMNKALLRMGILLSAVGSLSGCTCLMMTLVNIVQIKLGTLGCSGAAAAAVVPLVILVPLAMVVYVIIFYAFTR